MSSVKLGLAVAWPAFWTAIPAKIVFALLLLAAGLHPWEETGLAFLLLLSIPVDIWALGVSARTVFLERLRVQPPDSVGLILWWQAALFSAIYLPIAYVIGGQTVSIAKAVADSIMEIELLKSVPVAERIGITLTMWGSVATVMLLILVLGWLFIFGRIVCRQAAAGSPSDAPYQALVRQWDLMRVPADQPLLLTLFAASGVGLVLLFWAFMPVTTPHPHELYTKEPVKAAPLFKPAEALQKTERLIAQAEVAVQVLEEKAQEEAKAQAKGKGKGKAKGPGQEAASPKAQPAGSDAKTVKGEKAPAVAGQTK